MTPSALVLSVVMAFALAAPAPALHEDLVREIRRLDASIAEEPLDPDLYLLRAEVYRELRRWPEALADLGHAARLAPEAAEHHFLRARLFRDSGWSTRARVEVDRFVATRPGDARGYALRARLALAAGDAARAEADFERTLARTEAPDADLYTDRARATTARGTEHLERALAGLEAGITDVGDVPVLTRAAIDVEARLGRWDAALERLDKSASSSPRREWWLAERGDLLLRAGRVEAALESLRAARRALAALAPKRRNTRSVLSLAARIDARLLELEGSPR